MSITSCGTIKVVIPVKFSWSPGQHIFIRFLTLNVHQLTSHPFSICSLPSSLDQQNSSELVLYIRPRGGLTSRLAALARSRPSQSWNVLLDGPYGGVESQTYSRFDKVLIIAGGSGAGYTLPLVEDVIRRSESDGATLQDEKLEASPKNTEIQLILATRERDVEDWYKDAINEHLDAYPASRVKALLKVAFHYTGPPDSDHSVEKSKTALEGSEISVTADNIDRQTSGSLSSNDRDSGFSTTSHLGRPKLASIIMEAASDVEGSLGIAICGPSSMLQDVRNAAAEAQIRIMDGKCHLKEVYLHTEAFSYVSHHSSEACLFVHNKTQQCACCLGTFMSAESANLLLRQVVVNCNSVAHIHGFRTECVGILKDAKLRILGSRHEIKLLEL